jgi:hypothetical protein
MIVTGIPFNLKCHGNLPTSFPSSPATAITPFPTATSKNSPDFAQLGLSRSPSIILRSLTPVLFRLFRRTVIITLNRDKPELAQQGLFRLL